MVENGSWVLALTGTLALPDICAAVGSSNGKTSGSKYKNWFKKYLAPEYPMIDAEELWQLRCIMLQQGTSSTVKYKRVLFIHPSATSLGHKNIIDEVINLDLPTFCADVASAVRKWQADVQHTETYRKNADTLIRWHPNGLEPYMFGAPVLS